MSDTVEMQSTHKGHAHAGPASAWPKWTLVSLSHAVGALLLILVAISAAVGIGQSDWYTHQLYAQSKNGPGNTGWQVNYYGLQSVKTCTGQPTMVPQINYDNLLSIQNAACSVNLYSGLRRAAPGDDVSDAEPAYKHLQGAGDIIIVMLSLAILFGILGFYHNFFHAYHYSIPTWFPNRARHQRLGRLCALLCFVLEFLAIIFWVTIFPYKFITDYEFTTGAIANAPDFVYYYTIGTGFSIQIAGLIFAFVAFIITGKNPHAGNSAAATPSGV
jgi:hypothetical protein